MIRQMVVVMTGCDSGLGYRLAAEAARAGLTVVAGFLGGRDSHAAQLMRSQLPAKSAPGLHTVGLDVTNERSVADVANYVTKLLASDKNHHLHAVVNNAGVKVFGEFEWQTMEHMRYQLDVNVLGTWRVSKAFAPLLRRTAAERTMDTLRPRLIVVGSRSSVQPLPLLSVYGASKAASAAWCEVMRMELKPFGVDVINFIPGPIVGSTEIIADQNKFAIAMRAAFDDEMVSTHGANFAAMYRHFSKMNSWKPTPPDSFQDPALTNRFMAAVLDENPMPQYMHRWQRYALYHFLFGAMPVSIRYWLVRQFLGNPMFKHRYGIEKEKIEKFLNLKH